MNSTSVLTKNKRNDIFNIYSSTINYDNPAPNVFRIVGSTGISDNTIGSTI